MSTSRGAGQGRGRGSDPGRGPGRGRGAGRGSPGRAIGRGWRGAAPEWGPRRVTVLVCLAVLCALVLSPELRLYIDQQREIAALEREVAEHERTVDDLDEEVAAWSDDAYVAAQARDRLRYVFPGETGYVTGTDVLGEALAPDGDVAAAAAAGQRGGPADAEPDGGQPEVPPEGTWFGRVWSSIEAAGTGAPDPVLDDPVAGDPLADDPAADRSGGP